jgi:2-polyprenyl-6-methoxyphenol hydroxylase-like FAD-dependent oxidoreductase
MSIAIPGGGILGVCAGLELADRGFHGMLFERNPERPTPAKYTLGPARCLVTADRVAALVGAAAR